MFATLHTAHSFGVRGQLALLLILGIFTGKISRKTAKFDTKKLDR